MTSQECLLVRTARCCSPISVSARARNFVRRSIEEVGYITMEFPGGVFVHNHVSWLAPVKLRSVSVVGSRALLRAALAKIPPDDGDPAASENT